MIIPRENICSRHLDGVLFETAEFFCCRPHADLELESDVPNDTHLRAKPIQKNLGL